MEYKIYKPPYNFKLKILCIEDDLEQLEYLKISLDVLEQEITFEENPVKGLEIFKKNANLDKKDHFELLLLDYVMYPINGITFTEEVRKIDPNIPIILFSQEGSNRRIRKEFFLNHDNVKIQSKDDVYAINKLASMICEQLENKKEKIEREKKLWR